jgi:hypothetical protein
MKYQTLIVLLIIVLFMNLTGHGQNVPDTARTFRIETKDGIRPHRDPKINGIPTAVIIFPKYAGCRIIL